MRACPIAAMGHTPANPKFASDEPLCPAFADHSVLTLSPTDYAAIDTQVTTDSSTKDDCEVLRQSAEAAPWAVIEVPHFGSLEADTTTRPAK